MSDSERQVACEGCDSVVPLSAIKHAMDEGNVCHYCGDCWVEYQSLVTAVKSEGARVQRLLDLFTADARLRSPLKLVPQDFPPRDIPLLRLA